ncbi:MAG: pantoate--beta-alanine ligase [Variovorax sp.]|nr:pantoate--beta-alanine ligase [Variovorax sp.]
MRIAHTLTELRNALDGHRRPAFVPTMGNLHAGHIALIERAKPLGDVTVASIFVNRLQFLPHEDFDSYPRTWERDCEQLRAAGCDVLFAPRETDLYPEPQTFKVHPDPALANLLEGQFRPGFFIGVSTVVMKLFSCVQPRVTVFGKKDYQQLMVIRQLVNQFAMPIEVIGAETLRADDGLALSSRNGALSAEERLEAVQLYQVLRAMSDEVRETGGRVRDLGEIENRATQALVSRGWQPDYLALRRRSDLLPPAADDMTSPMVAVGAARLGNIRLIDNLEIEF